MDRERAVARFRQRDDRFQRRVHHLLRLEDVLEHVVGFVEAPRGVAVSELIIERDIGVSATREMLQIGEGARGPQNVMDDRGFGLRRLDFVEHGRQLFVVGAYRLHGALGDVGIVREHDGDRLADIANFFQRQDRLVVKGGAVIRVGNEFLDVVAGDDGEDAVLGACRVGVDRADAAVRNGRAENLAGEHAGNAQIMDVLGAARHLCARFQSRYRPANLLHGARFPNASRTARLR